MSKERRAPRTPAQLRDKAASLQGQAGVLIATADLLTKLKEKSVTIDGVTKIDRGIAEVNKFLKNLESAMLQFKYER